jgi:hypothetical protein
VTKYNAKLGNWKHIRPRYVAAAGALAIVAGGLAATAPWHGQSSSPAAAAAVVPATIYRPSEAQKAIFYLVGSQAEADRFNGTTAKSGTAGLNKSISVAVVDSPEDLVKMVGPELTSVGISYDIIDLRGR